MTRPPYLFNPETVEARIAPLPSAAKLIHEKKRVGDASTAYPQMQKTQREILRIIGRAHVYAHLDELLGSLERCLVAGWDAHQLGSRDRDEFASLMSDLQVAEHCLIRGFTIESPVGLKIQGPKPDLYIRARASWQPPSRCSVRASCPPSTTSSRTRRASSTKPMSVWTIEPTSGSTLYRFDENGKLVSPWHPIDLDEALAPVAEEALEHIAAKLAALESGGCEELTKE